MGDELRFDGRGHRIPLAELTGGRTITIYGQQKVVEDLIEARLADGAPLHFEVGDVRAEGFDGDAPMIRYRHDGAEHQLQCDVIAGCDGFHGVTRDAIPSGVPITRQPWGANQSSGEPATTELAARSSIP